MDDFLRTLSVISDGEISQDVWNALNDVFERKEGIHCVKATPNQIEVSFFTYQYSEEFILNMIKRTGFREHVEPSKSLWNRMLDALVGDDETPYTTKRLDCCSLNSINQKQSRKIPRYLKSSTRFQK